MVGWLDVAGLDAGWMDGLLDGFMFGQPGMVTGRGL